jgi:hypothetical protein
LEELHYIAGPLLPTELLAGQASTYYNGSSRSSTLRARCICMALGGWPWFAWSSQMCPVCVRRRMGSCAQAAFGGRDGMNMRGASLRHLRPAAEEDVTAALDAAVDPPQQRRRMVPGVSRRLTWVHLLRQQHRVRRPLCCRRPAIGVARDATRRRHQLGHASHECAGVPCRPPRSQLGQAAHSPAAPTPPAPFGPLASASHLADDMQRWASPLRLPP